MLKTSSSFLISATDLQLVSVEVISGASATSGITINMGNQFETLNIIGSTYYGSNLTGGFGSDVITGGRGNDIITGGRGSDTLTGNGGADVFVFNTLLGASNIDYITDFNALDDKIYLDRNFFTGLSAGALTTGAFNSAALEVDDRIIFNSSTGAMSFDADGRGALQATQFATLYGGWVGSVSAKNFVVM
jgi:Ca2+-binding RTX toxin-like protein